MLKELKTELRELWSKCKSLDKKVVVIFVSVGLLQTISWYYTSRRFFRQNLYFTAFEGNDNVQLYEYLFWFIGDFITYFVLPFIIIKLLLKEKISEYGFTLGDKKTGLKISLIFLLVMLPIIWFVSSMPEFSIKYPHLQSAKESWTLLLIFEAGMLLYMFAWEFIWRGFMLFGLKEKFGYYAIFIQMIPFVILHNGKPDIETFSAILGGLALGVLAFRTRSFLYGVIVHFGIMLSIDIISTLRFRADDFGIGIKSLINVISKIF